MRQCGSLINLACIQNETCLPRFEYMIMNWQILQQQNFYTQTSYCERYDAVELEW